MKAKDFLPEDKFGTNPKRPARAGSRPPRKHDDRTKQIHQLHSATGWDVSHLELLKPDELDDLHQKHVDQKMAEVTGDEKFDKMLKGITGKKEVAKQQKTDTKQQARDAFGDMFGGGNPADKLSIRKKGVAEGSDKTAYPNATVIKSKNGRPIGEIYQDEPYGWGAYHYGADNGADSMSSREQALAQLKDMHYEYRKKDVAEASASSSRSRAGLAKLSKLKSMTLDQQKEYLQKQLEISDKRRQARDDKQRAEYDKKMALKSQLKDKDDAKKDVDEGLGKSIKRAAQGWGSPQDKPADIVKRNRAYDTDTAKKVRAGIDGAPDHTPQGLQKRVLDRKLKGVDEGIGDEIKHGLRGLKRKIQGKPSRQDVKDKYIDRAHAAEIEGNSAESDKNAKRWERVHDKTNDGMMEGTGYKSQFPSAAPAIQYAKDKVKTFRDPDDGIEIWSMPDGGCDVVHTSNSNGRYHVIDNRGKKLGTIRPQKQGNK